MRYYASPKFWELLNALPSAARDIADNRFAEFRDNPYYPHLHFIRIGKFWSYRAGPHHRVLGLDVDYGIMWIWIGSGSDYDKLVG